MKPEPATEIQVETYLRRATRGLWGKKRLEVREELEAHLAERALSYQIVGMDEESALERALLELGSPREVSLGMTRLYTLPTVAGSGIIFAILCVLTLAAWPHTVAQGVKSIFYYPTKECVRALEPGSPLSIPQVCDSNTLSDVWLERQEFVQTLRKQEVAVTGAETLTLAFPDARPVTVRAGSPGKPEYDIKPAASSYVSLSAVMSMVAEQNQIGISVEGWDNPRAHLGDAVVQIGSDTRLVPGSRFYQTYLHGFVLSRVAKAVYRPFLFTPRADIWREDYGVKEQALEVVAKPGEVYGIIAILDPKLPAKLFSDEPGNPNAAFFADTAFTVFSTDVAKVAGGGSLKLYLPEQPLRFVKSLGTHPKPGTAVLGKLSDSKNQQGYEVVSPEQVRYQNSKYKAQN